MSLSSLLLAKTKAVDTELDALFKTSATPAATPKSSTVDVKKRKLHSEKDVQDEGAPVLPRKKAKSVEVKSVKFAKNANATKRETKVEIKASAKEVKEKVKAKKGKGKAKEVNEDEDEDDEEDNNSDLENAYLKSKTAKAKRVSSTEAAGEKEETDEEEDSEGEGESTQIVHESIQPKPKPAKRQRFVPADETPEQRDRRTIFIGNLPSEVTHKRPLRKQLEHHITALVPTSKIESVRFRSVAFQAPTAKLPTDADNPSSSTKTKTPRPHVQDRTATWRSKVDEKDDEFVKQDDKKFLTPNQKKKIAFINQEFHSSADCVNAYVVFAHPVEVKDRPANLPPPKEVMDPYEAAKAAVEKCDGTVFMERMIRVDVVGREAVEKGKESVGDPKLAVFVGNLDFASKEEDLRAFFEGVVSAERGPPPLKEDEEGVKKPNNWVTRVRIVRDKETQLGKGFAYIQFADRECVDEVLALEEQKLKFAKRKLRVQRCKSLPGAKVAVDAKTHPKAANTPRSAPVPIVIPKGDPALGERLAHLSKDARKQAKSIDADRVARRLAKKKARMAMGPPGGSGVKGKDRERVRKPASGSGSSKAKNFGRKEGKGRVRSEKSLLKRNLKK